jgi:hypothetical protein
VAPLDFRKNSALTFHEAVATLGFIILLFCRFPPEGSKRYVEEHVPEAAPA